MAMPPPDGENVAAELLIAAPTAPTPIRKSVPAEKFHRRKIIAPPVLVSTVGACSPFGRNWYIVHE